MKEMIFMGSRCAFVNIKNGDFVLEVVDKFIILLDSTTHLILNIWFNHQDQLSLQIIHLLQIECMLYLIIKEI